MALELEKVIGHTFRNRAVFETALIHSSFSNESKGAVEDNERQEFLGDAVLSIIVSDYLFKHLSLPEGDLTKLRASLVCEASLARFAKKIDLGSYLHLGKGEELNGGRTRPSILADAFEALIAAIYLDGGMEAASGFVLPFVLEIVKHNEDAGFQDYKTQLQEIVQKNPEERVSYVLVSESGPDHDKWFEVEVRLNSNVIGHGSGHSKKAAEQMAACEALQLMGE